MPRSDDLRARMRRKQIDQEGKRLHAFFVAMYCLSDQLMHDRADLIPTLKNSTADVTFYLSQALSLIRKLQISLFFVNDCAQNFIGVSGELVVEFARHKHCAAFTYITIEAYQYQLDKAELSVSSQETGKSVAFALTAMSERLMLAPRELVHEEIRNRLGLNEKETTRKTILTRIEKELEEVEQMKSFFDHQTWAGFSAWLERVAGAVLPDELRGSVDWSRIHLAIQGELEKGRQLLLSCRAETEAKPAVAASAAAAAPPPVEHKKKKRKKKKKPKKEKLVVAEAAAELGEPLPPEDGDGSDDDGIDELAASKAEAADKDTVPEAPLRQFCSLFRTPPASPSSRPRADTDMSELTLSPSAAAFAPLSRTPSSLVSGVSTPSSEGTRARATSDKDIFFDNVSAALSRLPTIGFMRELMSHFLKTGCPALQMKLYGGQILSAALREKGVRGFDSHDVDYMMLGVGGDQAIAIKEYIEGEGHACVIRSSIPGSKDAWTQLQFSIPDADGKAVPVDLTLYAGVHTIKGKVLRLDTCSAEVLFDGGFVLVNNKTRRHLRCFLAREASGHHILQTCLSNVPEAERTLRDYWRLEKFRLRLQGLVIDEDEGGVPFPVELDAAGKALLDPAELQRVFQTLFTCQKYRCVVRKLIEENMTTIIESPMLKSLLFPIVDQMASHHEHRDSNTCLEKAMSALDEHKAWILDANSWPRFYGVLFSTLNAELNAVESPRYFSFTTDLSPGDLPREESARSAVFNIFNEVAEHLAETAAAAPAMGC